MGSRALCAWLRRCRVAVGEVHGESFVKLLGASGVSVVVRSRDMGML